MGVEQAYEQFRAIRQTLPPDDDRPITDNEACTRVHLIDPILTRVLGWPLEHTVVEAPGGESDEATPTGTKREGRVDYVVRDRESVCWFVIEAKKRSLPIVQQLGTVQGVKKLKLGGAVLGNRCWPIIGKQMMPYLGRYMPCFGAVTTGEQWVGFLGILKPGNVLLEDTDAVVFRSLDDIEEDFELFYEFFGIEGTRRRTLLRHLQSGNTHGLVRAPEARRVVPPGGEKPIDYQGVGDFYVDLRQAMDAAFRPILKDTDALAACFVESRESQDASSRLERIATELGEALRDTPEHYPPAVAGQVEAVADGKAFEEAFEPGDGYLARLLGEKSAGKTVFLRRFFNSQLHALRERIVLLWLNVDARAPFEPTQATRAMLGQMKAKLFGDEGPSWEHFREIYRREWNQRLRLVGLPEKDASLEMREAFLDNRHAAETMDPQDALRRYAEFATKNRKRLVCLVVDNLDHLERPEPVLAWAVAMHKSMFAMTTVAMEDATLWRLRRRSVDQLGDHQPEQFWLHRPMVREVIQNRCEYLKKTLENAPVGASRTSTTIGRRGQWKWSSRPEDLVRVVSAVLLDNEETAQWIGQISNYDLRDVLDICQQIVLSPHVRADKLFSMQVVKSVSRYSVLRTLIAPKSEQYQKLPTDRVVNIFGHWLSKDFAPLLPARLLSILRAREDADRNRREPFAGFVAVDELLDIVESATSVPRSATIATLRYLSTTRIVEPFNPADQALDDANGRVKITARGRLHLEWALKEPMYVRLMAEVDPIVSDTAYRDLRSRWQTFLGSLSPARESEATGTNVVRRELTEQRSRLERDVASAYVKYILEQAEASSPVVGGEDVESLRSFEREARTAWGIGTSSGAITA